MDWPDHGAPETFETLLQLLKLARKIHPNDQTPLLVHCRWELVTAHLMIVDHHIVFVQDLKTWKTWNIWYEFGECQGKPDHYYMW